MIAKIVLLVAIERFTAAQSDCQVVFVLFVIYVAPCAKYKATYFKFAHHYNSDTVINITVTSTRIRQAGSRLPTDCWQVI